MSESAMPGRCRVCRTNQNLGVTIAGILCSPCGLPCAGGTFSPEERFHDRACVVCRKVT